MTDAIPPKVSKIVDVLVSLGASVVLFGALQKLMHTSLADIMLQVGLYTESLIFLGYGILYLYYPAVDDRGIPVDGEREADNPALKSMEKMLQEADITPTNLSKLSGSFQKLNTSVSQIGEIGDVLKSTNDFTVKTKEAALALSSVSGAVSQAVTSLSSLSSLNSVSESTKQFHGQVQVLTKNLSSLNTVYELELQESNNQLKALNQFYGKLAQTSSAMLSSTDDAMKAKEQITALANNLSKLNQVYGSMLTAMQGR
jgi:gliding motility-associated protein GldL